MRWRYATGAGDAKRSRQGANYRKAARHQRSLDVVTCVPNNMKETREDHKRVQDFPYRNRPACRMAAAHVLHFGVTLSFWHAGDWSTSSFPTPALIEVPLLEHHVLAHDQPVSGHLLQSGQHATYVLIGIHENDDHRKLATGFHQMCRLHSVTPRKPAGGPARLISPCLKQGLYGGVGKAAASDVSVSSVGAALMVTRPAPLPCRQAHRLGRAGCC